MLTCSLRPFLALSGSYWISPCLSLALYGSLWLPLWLPLALTATLWLTLALSGSLLLSNFAYTVLDHPSGPLLGSQRRCHADALCPCLLLSSIKSNHHKKMMRKTWDNDEAWYRTQHDTGPVPEDPFPFIPNWPIPNLRHTHTILSVLLISGFLLVPKDRYASIRGGICHSRHSRRECKIFASGVNFSRNNAVCYINESKKLHFILISSLKLLTYY